MLEVKNISKTYTPKKGQPVKALDNVSIKFPEKGLVFILGKSGSGKSTLLNVLGGLDKVDSGDIIIKGKSSKDFSQSDFDSYRNTYLGFIFQEYNILNEFTVGDNIALAIKLQGRKPSKDSVENILEQVDLKGYAKRKPNELSGGQKQRIAIARALIKNPEIILADEPTGALDSRTGIQVFDTLKELSKNKLVIVVSHDREFAELYGDRVIEMKDGKVISDIEKVYQESKTTSSGLIQIDNHLLALKKGHVLTDDDIKRLNDILKNYDTLISADSQTNKEIKKVARIGEDFSRESFSNTDEDKIIYDSNQKFSMIKSSLPLSQASKIGASALKSKPVRLFFTILLSVLSFAMFGVVDTISGFNAINTVYDGLIHNDSQAYSLVKQSKDEEYDYYEDDLFTDEDIASLKQEYNIEVDKVYNSNQYYFSFSNNFYDHSFGSSVIYNDQITGFLSLDNNRLNQLGFNVEYGYYPTMDNEVAITDYQYCLFKENGFRGLNGNGEEIIIEPEEMSQEKLLGNYLSFSKGNLKISGIINTGFGYSFSSSAYGDLLSKDYNLIYNDTTLKNLYNQYRYQVVDNYPNGVYVTSSFVEELDNNYGFYSSNNIKEGNFIAELSNTEGFYNYFDCFTTLDRLQLDYYFFDENKTSLASDEIIVSQEIYNSIIDTYINNGGEITILDEDKVQEEIYFERTYDDYGIHNGWTKFVNQIEINAFNDLVYLTPNITLYDYCINNLPQDNPLFDDYIKGFYSLEKYNYETGETSYEEYPEGQIDDEMKAYAYINAITMPESIVNEPKYYGYEDLVNYANQYVFDYQMREEQNIFGGKTQSSIDSEYRANLYKKYFSEQELIGTIYFESYNSPSSPSTEHYKVVGAFEYSLESYELYNGIVISNEIFQSIEPHLMVGYRSLLTDLTDNSQALEQLLNSTYDETSENRIKVGNAVSESIDMFVSTIDMLSEVLFYVSIGLAIFSGLLLMNFISTSISYKKKEIGILRAVGAKSFDVFKIFFSEAFFIAVINFVFACVLSAVGVYFFNSAMVDTIGSLGSFFMFGIRQILLLIGLSVAIAFVASFLPVYLVAKKRPVEAIRSI